MPTPEQSNVQEGQIILPTNSDISDSSVAPANGRLLKLINSSGAPRVDKLAAKTDRVMYIGSDCDGGSAAGANVGVIPLSPRANMRCFLKGTCVPGDILVPADPTTAADAGKVVKAAGSYGTVQVIGFAEETGADGQLVLFRPAGLGFFQTF